MMSKLQAVAIFGGLLGAWVCVVGCTSDAVDAGAADASVDAASTSIAATEFARTCSVDTDCTAIYEGTVCRLCQCPNAVIATSARDAYQDRFAALQTACAPHPTTHCEADCIGIEPRCNAGTCERNGADGG